MIELRNNVIALLLGVMALVPIIYASDSYSPYVDQSFPTNVYWGDTHLHTNLSMDVGDTYNPMSKGLSPDDAYRFAQGEVVITHNGMKFRRQRPLDFLVIADHAENIGLYPALVAADPIFMKTNQGQKLRTRYEATNGETKEMLELWYAIYKDYGISGEPIEDKAFRRAVWDEVIANADKHNDPRKFTAFIGYEFSRIIMFIGIGDKHNDPRKFTAFIGYEWTSWEFNIHRVVILEDDAEKARRFLPFTQYDSDKPEDLWAYLSRYEREMSGNALAIPHNGNLTRGHMFRPLNSKGQPLTKAYATTRNRWEPLYEVTQIKGDSEAHPLLSPDDEFADFETLQMVRETDTENALRNREYEYARSALKLGLDLQSKVGVNPFKFGMIGSSDAHGSLSSVAENNYVGKGVWVLPSEKRLSMAAYPASETIHNVPSWKLSASGYAAVWAKENTREALFAAMKRKEVYASTGPRITVRFFGGWDYEEADAFRPDLANIGYSKGVSMGGDLTNAPQGKEPRFLIRAVKDPDGANLDRVQTIKGWLDKNGETHEKIYNVSLSDGRSEDENGHASPVGNTVNIPDASYTNTIGDPELAVVWIDPDFDPDELAFYYVRVMEIPTPRWTAYDAKFFKLKNIPKEVPMVTQERAYTSPIWYTPTGFKPSKINRPDKILKK